MNKSEKYKEALKNVPELEAYLLEESGLPGPRANLELVYAAADTFDEEYLKHLVSYIPDKAPDNSPYLFLALCGVVGLGRLASEGKKEYLETLRTFASDPRWRVREGVAMALQTVGDRDMVLLLSEMKKWSTGNPLEKRAVAAALCEPRLLHKREEAQEVLQILDNITTSIEEVENRKSDEFKTLRKGLGYCWSVVVAALPDAGKKLMEKWIESSDKDIRWIMNENLKKNRLIKMDSIWVEQCKQK